MLAYTFRCKAIFGRKLNNLRLKQDVLVCNLLQCSLLKRFYNNDPIAKKKIRAKLELDIKQINAKKPQSITLYWEDQAGNRRVVPYDADQKRRRRSGDGFL
jgi:hypothetical protein